MQYKSFADVPLTEWRWSNFTPQEIACKGTGALIINEHAMDCLQAAREEVGKPFKINSGYRSIEHNKSVGGSKNSRHMNGSAFDISREGHNLEELLSALMTNGFTGIGIYNSFIHADTGRPRTWDHRNG